MAIIITICTLLLIAYVFDLSSSVTKIPSVILLLLLGWFARQLAIFFEIQIPELTGFLPILGTIGLILIVLEGSLELEYNHSKLSLIKKSFFIAFFPIFLLSFLLAFLFQYYGDYTFKESLINAIPISVISSAIAIPSVKDQPSFDKEFVTYESSFSDIIGILFFDFIAMNDSIGTISVGHFTLNLVIVIAVSFIASIALAFLLNKIEHHIKFVPIILLVVLIYAVSKFYHLPALIFILFFGLFLGNLDEFKEFKWIQKLKPEELNKEILKLKEINIEVTFLMRALFFLLFGYLIETRELLNLQTFFWAFGIVATIFAIRALAFKIFKVKMSPLVFIAPRGLITILLFISIAPEMNIPLVNKSLIMQVIVLTALIMMVGLIGKNQNKQEIQS